MADLQPHGSFLEARYDFRQRRQGEDETLGEYLTAIRTLAVCNLERPWSSVSWSSS